MTKNTDNYDNIQFIQYLNRKMLEEAEEAITLELPGDGVVPQVRQDDNTVEKPTDEQLAVEAAKRKIVKRRHRMWGYKNPIAWVLEKIADTELKIDKQRPPQIAQTDQPPKLDEKDVALVKHYLERQAEP